MTNTKIIHKIKTSKKLYIFKKVGTQMNFLENGSKMDYKIKTKNEQIS